MVFMSLGVCLSHAILMQQCIENIAREDDVVLTFSTIYWISGLLLLVCSAIKGFRRIITTERFSVELMLEMIEEHRVRAHSIFQFFKNIQTDFPIFIDRIF